MGPRGKRQRLLAAVGAVALLGAGMAVTGYGTGAGPLGAEDGGGTYGLMRPAGTTFTTGIPLRHRGWFDVHIESIRPVPKDGAASGMPLRELALSPQQGVGMVEGTGETSVPRKVRRPVKGYVIPADHASGEWQNAEGLATWEIAKGGRWTYEGYEITYRHGPVRHRWVYLLGTEGCTLSEAACDS